MNLKIEVAEIFEDRKKFLPLLLLADEQESMIDKYLECGRMFILQEKNISVAVCVVADVGDKILEIKNLAVDKKFQRKGYGRFMIEFVSQKFKDKFSILQVGTGDSPATLPFYESCDFKRHHVIKNFFIDNYDHKIFEGGVQLADMIILRKTL